MSTKVGDIYVEMRASTASFMAGMQQTVASSKAAAAGIQSAFSGAGIPLPTALVRGISDLGRVSFDTSRQASASFRVIGTVVAAAAVAAAGALAHVTVRAAENMDQLARLGEKYGLTADQMAGLEYAAKLTETDVTKLAFAFGGFSTKMVNAAQGSKAAVDLFERLGVKVTEAGKLRDTAVVFDEVAAKMAAMGSGAEKTALGVELFSRRGLDLIPIIDRLPGGLAGAAEAARSLGLAFGEDGKRQAEQFSESLRLLDLEIEGAKRQFALGLLPALNDLIAAFAGGVEAGNGFRAMGEGLGTMLKDLVAGVDRGWTSLYKFSLGLEKAFALMGAGTGFEMMTNEAAQAGKDLAEALDYQMKDLEKKSNEFRARLFAPPKPLVLPRVTGEVGLGPSKAPSDAIAKTIAQLREQLGATQALASAQYVDEAAVRRVTAANEADAIILRLSLELKDRHLKGLTREQEALIRSLAITLSLAKAEEQEVASARKKLEHLTLSTAQYQRLADATMVSTEAVREAMVANEMDAAAVELQNVPTERRITLLERLHIALEAASKQQERYNLAQEALSVLSPAGEYEKTITRLAEISQVLAASGKDLSGVWLAADRALDQYKASEDEFALRHRTFVAGATVALRQYADNAKNAAVQAHEGLTVIMRDLEDGLVNAVTTGSLKIKDIFKSMLADIARMITRTFITSPLSSLLGGLLGKLLGGGISSGATFIAQGGIMTPRGSLPLRRYDFGGVAMSPQLAIFGEGRLPEAYVPLPDGRSIPVTMRGGAGGNIYVDARGADAAVEYRVMRAVQMAEARATVRAAAVVEERQRRGYR